MNGMATDGKNFQTISALENQKGAYEIRLVSPSAPDHKHPAHLCSLAKRQRTPCPLPMRERGAAAPSALPLPTKRPARNYGGRSMRYRNRDLLKPWQVQALHAADAVASQLGMPLNVFVTVNYHGTFPGGGAMAATFKKAMKRIAAWFAYHGIPVAYAYVHENPGDEKPNTHLLIHVPKQLRRAFKEMAPRWFDAMDGGVQVDPRNDAQRLAKGRGTRLQYMAKGADHLTCRRYGGHRATGGQGPVPFKRAGVAQCLRPGLAIAHQVAA